MSITYTNAVKQARLTAVSTQIGAAGKLEIGTAGMATVLATFTLPAATRLRQSGRSHLTRCLAH